MEPSLHDVSHLSADARSVVESLIGHALAEGQKFFIVALDDANDLSREQRAEAWQELAELMAEMQRNAGASGLSDLEIDRVIDETCEEVRYGRK